MMVLRKHRGYCAVVIVSLALAISVNTAMYSVLDAMIHPRLDMREPDQLYTVRLFGNVRSRVTAADVDTAVRSAVPSVESSASFEPVFTTDGLIERGNNAYEGHGLAVSREYFDLLAPRLIAGRTFIASDVDAEVTPLVASEALIEALFPGGQNPIGARVTIGSNPFVIIGVISKYSELPPDLPGEAPYAMWTLAPPRRTAMYARLIRVRHGVSRTEVERDMARIAARIAVADGDDPRDVAFRLHRASEPQFHLNNFHYALIVAVAAVLLVACANLANMQLARGISRGRELAVRAALGATRRRLAAELLGETALLATLGLAAGLVLTYWGTVLLRAAIPPSIGEYVVQPHLSWRVLVFAVFATVACIGLVGVAPAISVSRADPHALLKSGAGTGATRKHRRQYDVLVAAELALALGLLCGAAVMARSAIDWGAVPWLGVDPRIIAGGYRLIGSHPGERRSTSELLSAVAAGIRGPEVADAAALIGGKFDDDTLTLGDSSGARQIALTGYGYTVVSPSYLRTLKLPVIDGRDFRDGERDEAVAIVDQYTARLLWPNASPLGAMIKFGGSRSRAPFVRIIGVVGHAPDPRRGRGQLDDVFDGRSIGSIYYLPGPRDSITASGTFFFAQVIARAAENPSRLPVTLRHAGVMRAQTLDEQMGISRGRESRAFVAKIFGLFAALGVGLAIFGVYGVVAHSVAERRREFGVRIALGATTGNILHAVLRESVTLGLVATAAGLTATKYGVLLLRALASGDEVFNAPMFAGLAVCLLAAAGASALLPALEATQVDPTESLRSE